MWKHGSALQGSSCPLHLLGGSFVPLPLGWPSPRIQHSLSAPGEWGCVLLPVVVLSLPGSTPKPSNIPHSRCLLLSQRTSYGFPGAQLRCLDRHLQTSLVWKLSTGTLSPSAQGLWDLQKLLGHQRGKPPNPALMLQVCNGTCSQPHKPRGGNGMNVYQGCGRTDLQGTGTFELELGRSFSQKRLLKSERWSWRGPWRSSAASFYREGNWSL